MQIIPDSEFLAWAAEGGLRPDPRYTQSLQLVHADHPDCCSVWHPLDGHKDLTGFVGTMIRLAWDDAWYVRMRGGGVFASAVAELDSDGERALSAASLAAGIPLDTRGAVLFEQTEFLSLRDLAAAFLLFGYCVGTDLEIVAADRGACLMLSHHHEVVGHFCSRDRLAKFDAAMIAAGYGEPIV